MTVECANCGKNLYGHPKIAIYEDYLNQSITCCFRCAKKLVRAKVPHIQQEYERDIQLYESHIANLREQRKEYFALWSAHHKSVEAYNCKRRGFISSKPSTASDIDGWRGVFLFLIVAIGILSLWGIPLLVTWAYFRNKADTQEEAVRANEFDASHSPPAEFTVPCPPHPNSVSRPLSLDRRWRRLHYPLPPDGAVLASGQPYRPYVLRRDNYICQKCGKGEKAISRENLDVHHIIPRARNGSDDLTNLITLCRNCHRRETWYGHYHIDRDKRRWSNISDEPGTYDIGFTRNITM